jgi:hypothetical protein
VAEAGAVATQPVPHLLVVASQLASQQAVAAKFLGCRITIERASGVTEATAALAATRFDAIVVEATDGPGQTALLLQLVRFALPATAARARVILLLEPELRSAYLDAAAWADCVLCFAHQPEIFRAAARIVEFPTARHEPSPGAQIALAASPSN